MAGAEAIGGRAFLVHAKDEEARAFYLNRVMQRKGTNLAVTDGPFAEAKEIIGGFFVVDARDYDEAVSVAKGCPHLDFGTIEVREIEPMP